MNRANAIWKCEDCGKTGTVDIYLFGEASRQLEKIESAHAAVSPDCPGKILAVELK
ncbi:MAG TPA: hypothetical protein P5080_03365 [Candidatus Paceibacterota bacterium]|nr:hypothetical protein [Candidatus Pacearchaeota archaeon]HRZ51007.1 hypothetical protein [Candidatus Paceibacterota bacterium]HSA36728.1 hypothetical protein [Candidatus Paceibacterota bacterium]